MLRSAPVQRSSLPGPARPVFSQSSNFISSSHNQTPPGNNNNNNDVGDTKASVLFEQDSEGPLIIESALLLIITAANTDWSWMGRIDFRHPILLLHNLKEIIEVLS